MKHTMRLYYQIIKIFIISVGALFTFCFGLTAGYIVFHPGILSFPMQQQKKIITPTVSPVIADKAEDIHLQLQQQEQEHVVMLSQLMQATFAGRADAVILRQQITQQNSERSKFYGK